MDWDLNVSWTRTIKKQTQKFKNKIKNTPWKLNFQHSLILTCSLTTNPLFPLFSLFLSLTAQPPSLSPNPVQPLSPPLLPLSSPHSLPHSFTIVSPSLSLSLSQSPSTHSALLSLSLTISFDFCEIWVWNWWKLCGFCGFFLLSVNMGLLYLMNCYGFFVLF